jgi:hypothetical protein
MLAPVNMISGGIIPSLCPPNMPTAGELNSDNPAIKAAAEIQKDTAEAKARAAAMRYLATVGCYYWPEAQDALIAGLRKDKNECVRWEAAKALGSGCCCTKKTIEALANAISSNPTDAAPAEQSDRVKTMAEASLQHCLECYREIRPAKGLEKPKPPEGVKPPEGAPPVPMANLNLQQANLDFQQATHYQQIDQRPAQEVIESARRTFDEVTRASRATSVPPPGSRSLSQIWANATMKSTPAAAPMPTVVSDARLMPEPAPMIKAAPPSVPPDAEAPKNLYDMWVARRKAKQAEQMTSETLPNPGVNEQSRREATPKMSVVTETPPPKGLMDRIKLSLLGSKVSAPPRTIPAAMTPANDPVMTPGATEPAPVRRPMDRVKLPLGAQMPAPAQSNAAALPPTDSTKTPMPAAMDVAPVKGTTDGIRLPQFGSQMPAPQTVPMPTAPANEAPKTPMPYTAPGATLPAPDDQTMNRRPLTPAITSYRPSTNPVVQASGPACNQTAVNRTAPAVASTSYNRLDQPAAARPASPVVQTTYTYPVYDSRGPARVDKAVDATKLVSVLSESFDPFQREWAARQLGTATWPSGTQVVDVLQKSATKDPAAVVRVQCIRSLVQRKVATPAVVKTLQSLRNDVDPRVRHEAEEGLGKISPTPSASTEKKSGFNLGLLPGRNN